MLRITQLLLGTLVFSTQMAFAIPKNIQLEYDVLRNGKRFATLNETFSQNGKQYSINSVTKGLGIYALLGQRTMTSTGEVTKEGLKPNHFELHQGKGGKKAYISDFNWAKNKLNMQMNGDNKTEPLANGTQDLASYVYQFMYSPPKADEVKVTLTTGKKLNQYRYKVVQRDVMLDAANNRYKTILVANDAAASDDKKQLWLAEGQNYLPVRYKLTDDDGNEFEQVLTKIHVE
jgi:hypothetical protein